MALGQRLAALFSAPATAWGLTLLVALVSAVRAVLVMEVIPGPGGRPNGPFDFNLDYLAAMGLRQGLGVYSARLQPERLQQLAATLHMEAWLGDYYYPPLTAQIILPLTWLPLHTAAYVWLAAMTACAIAGAWVLGRTVAQPYGVTWALLVVLLFFPTQVNILGGNISTVVFLTLCVAYAAARKFRWEAAGASLAVGAMLYALGFGELAILAGGVVVSELIILVAGTPLMFWIERQLEMRGMGLRRGRR